jgi:hypothetical protein
MDEYKYLFLFDKMDEYKYLFLFDKMEDDIPSVFQQRINNIYNCIGWNQYIDIEFLSEKMKPRLNVYENIAAYFSKNIFFPNYVYIHGPKEMRLEMRKLQIKLEDIRITSKISFD